MSIEKDSLDFLFNIKDGLHSLFVVSEINASLFDRFCLSATQPLEMLI